MKTDSSDAENSISRRKFINRTAAFSAGIAFVPVSDIIGNNPGDVTWPSDAGQFSFHMIGHAHIDPVWLWPWHEGLAVVHSSFRSALDRMNESDDFAFVATSSRFYEWVAENDPGMLKEIRRRVDEGRWNIAGGWWVEPDVNMPCGESMARQGLYGQLTFERLLGRRARVAMNPDSFGHPGSLPQIFKLQGMENYVFMRPGPHEKTIPADLFWWEGIDGTRVLTYRIPISYNVHEPSVKERVKEILDRFYGQPMKSFMAFYGVGDHGGGPTKANIRSINELKEEKGAPKVFFSTVDRYFDEIRSKGNLDFPVVSDDLQHHAVGCYTAESAIKKGNRQSEAALMTAEKISSLGSLVWGAYYPKDKLTSAWQRVLFLQFHDSLAGTSVPEHSKTAAEGYGYAMDISNQATFLALQKLEWQVPAEDPGSQYLLVFNPHAWESKSIIEYPFARDGEGRTTRVEDEKGNALPCQWGTGVTQTRSRHNNLIAQVTIPPMGYRQIRLTEGNPHEIANPVRTTGNTIENEYLRISFSDKGTIGIFDKRTGEEVFAGGSNGCRAVVIDDPSDTWSHDIKTYSDEKGEFGNATVKIPEQGPLRATARVISTYGDSSLTIDWSLTSGSGKLEAKVTLDWHERLKMLKFSFPVNIESPVATYEVPYGFIERETNGDEDPGQRWIDLSGRVNGKDCGLAVINDAKYGYNVIKNDMRISVARSAVYAHHDPWKLDKDEEYMWMDQGIQTFKMVLMPHRGGWKESNVVRCSEELTSPLVFIYQGIHPGKMQKSGSFLSVDKCIETAGEDTEATIDLDFADRKWQGRFRGCEIKTLRLYSYAGNINEVNILEE